MDSDVKQRLLLFLEEKRITQKAFSDSIGVSSAYIAAMRKSFGRDKIAEIKRVYPELNIDWLLYGEGEMLRAAEETCRSGRMVPLLPVEAYAGHLQNYSQGVALPECQRVYSPVDGADFAIRIHGDSMEPKFPDGTTILIKKINEKAFIPWGNPLVIDSENGVVVKNVYPVKNDNSVIEARSLNPAYPPYEIPRDCVYGLYRILGSIQLYSAL